jgi:hypothetical protein
MAVPTSGEISLRGVARERAYPNGNGPDIDAYTQGTIPPNPISLYDVMIGGNANGSGYDYCPPMDNEWVVNNKTILAPYDPNIQQGTGYTATPYAMSEFRGHIGNRELGCIKVNNSTNCYPTGTSSISANAAGQSIKLDAVLNYTPKGTGALIFMEITYVTWAGISTTSDTTGGSGVANVSFTAVYGSTARYLNIATNTGSARSLTLYIYISGSCYATNNLFHTVTVTQAAGSGGGGGGLPTKPGGGTQ